MIKEEIAHKEQLFTFPHSFLLFRKTPKLTQFSFQSHRLLFSHALAEVRGENTPEIKFASTMSRTHNHQVMSPTRSPLGYAGGLNHCWNSLCSESKTTSDWLNHLEYLIRSCVTFKFGKFLRITSRICYRMVRK